MAYTSNKKSTDLEAKTTPIDADVAILGDSADSGRAKKLTWANIKATLKTYFDTLYTLTKATQAEVATGTDDTKYVTPLAVQPYSNNSLYRQAIINGNFDVWQRGTSFSSQDNLYCADRWIETLSGASGVTTTRESFTVGQTDVPNNPKYYLKRTVTSGNDFCRLEQKIENVNNFSGQNVTLSFWAKGTMPSTGTLYVGYRQDFGTGGSPSTAVASYDYSALTITSTWTKYTVTIEVPSISGKTIGTDGYHTSDLSIIFGQGSNTNNGSWELNLSQVQLNAGSVALPFQPKSYADELKDCQRYYQNFVGAAYNTPPSAVSSTTAVYFPFILPTVMRLNPIVTFSGSRGTDWYLRDASDNTNTTGSLVAQTVGDTGKMINFVFNTGTFTAGTSYHILLQTSSSSINFSAEL